MPNRDSKPDQDVRRTDHWTVLENFETHAVGVLKPGQYRAKNLKHEPGVYEMTDLVPVSERDRLRVERDGFDEQCHGLAEAARETGSELATLRAENETLKEEQIAFVRDLETAQAENERLRKDAFTPDEIKLMAREISGMCDNASDGGSIPPVLWRRLANKLDRLARTSDDTHLAPEEGT